jgi:hypothetical protein
VSSNSLNAKQRFCLLKRRGYDTTKAAELAGYASTPPQDAYEVMQAMADESGKTAVDLQHTLEKTKWQLKQLRRRRDALEALLAEGDFEPVC